MTLINQQEARLVLEDGSVFSGVSIGTEKSVPGEVVFTTGMTGYPETLTDPSYKGQILVFTYPLLGNYGVPEKLSVEGELLNNHESGRVQVNGVIVGDCSHTPSHWTSKGSLSAWLKDEGIPGISGIDTRDLTKKIREKGVMLGRIELDRKVDFSDPNKENLVAQVSTDRVVTYGKGKRRIVLVDCGVKHSIIRALLKRDTTVIRVPWDYDFQAEEPDGVVISNGPGDPKHCRATVHRVKDAVDDKVPLFGICLGNQILALAAGAETYKLKYGHRGQNQPCIDMHTGRCMITSQNHGFAVDSSTLPEPWKPWWANANDHSNEGIMHDSGRFFSVQFHPEGNPGPEDTSFLFDTFMDVMDSER